MAMPIDPAVTNADPEHQLGWGSVGPGSVAETEVAAAGRGEGARRGG